MQKTPVLYFTSGQSPSFPVSASVAVKLNIQSKILFLLQKMLSNIFALLFGVNLVSFTNGATAAPTVLVVLVKFVSF